MSFFEELPSFGKWCGTCDICSYREVNGDELERDFAFDGARVLLGAVILCNGQVSIREKSLLQSLYSLTEFFLSLRHGLP